MQVPCQVPWQNNKAKFHFVFHAKYHSKFLPCQVLCFILNCVLHTMKTTAGNYRKRYRRSMSSMDEGPSALARLLIFLLSWGIISGPLAQEIAAAAESDGCQKPDLLRIAHAGCFGAYPANIKRDIFNNTLYGKTVPVSWIWLPVLTPRGDAPIYSSCHTFAAFAVPLVVAEIQWEISRTCCWHEGLLGGLFESGPQSAWGGARPCWQGTFGSSVIVAQ